LNDRDIEGRLKRLEELVYLLVDIARSEGRDIHRLEREFKAGRTFPQPASIHVTSQ
jgi:hypothetical protein